MLKKTPKKTKKIPEQLKAHTGLTPQLNSSLNSIPSTSSTSNQTFFKKDRELLIVDIRDIQENHKIIISNKNYINDKLNSQFDLSINEILTSDDVNITSITFLNKVLHFLILHAKSLYSYVKKIIKFDQNANFNDLSINLTEAYKTIHELKARFLDPYIDNMLLTLNTDLINYLNKLNKQIILLKERTSLNPPELNLKNSSGVKPHSEIVMNQSELNSKKTQTSMKRRKRGRKKQIDIATPPFAHAVQATPEGTISKVSNQSHSHPNMTLPNGIDLDKVSKFLPHNENKKNESSLREEEYQKEKIEYSSEKEQGFQNIATQPDPQFNQDVVPIVSAYPATFFNLSHKQKNISLVFKTPKDATNDEIKYLNFLNDCLKTKNYAEACRALKYLIILALGAHEAFLATYKCYHSIPNIEVLKIHLKEKFFPKELAESQITEKSKINETEIEKVAITYLQEQEENLLSESFFYLNDPQVAIEVEGFIATQIKPAIVCNDSQKNCDINFDKAIRYYQYLKKYEEMSKEICLNKIYPFKKGF